MHDYFSRRHVIEICSGFGPAAMAGKFLADLGCAVAKIETADGDRMRRDPGGEGSSLSLFSLISGAKDSVALDIGVPQAAELLLAGLRRADILLLDIAAWRILEPVLGKSTELEGRFPGLTVCVCSHFGLASPRSDWTGSEEIAQAMSGVMSTTGRPGSAPVRVPGAMLTMSAALCAVISILGDVIRKNRGGTTAFLDCGAMHPAAAFLTAAYPAWFLSGEPPAGIGNRHGMSAPWNTFPCADGWLVLCAGNEPSWRRLCAVIGRPDLLRDERFLTAETRVANVDALEQEISAWTRRYSIAEVERILDENGIPAGAIASLHDVLNHPQFEARQLLRYDLDGGIAGAAFRRNGEALQARDAKSALGEATRDVLVGRWGLTDTALKRAARAGALGVVVEEVA